MDMVHVLLHYLVCEVRLIPGLLSAIDTEHFKMLGSLHGLCGFMPCIQSGEQYLSDSILA